MFGKGKLSRKNKLDAQTIIEPYVENSQALGPAGRIDSGVEPTITTATNHQADWKTTIIAFAVVAMLTFGLWAALRYEVGITGWVNVVIVFPIAALAGWASLVVVSGELPALREIKLRSKNASERNRVEFQRVLSQEKVALAAIKAESDWKTADTQKADPQILVTSPGNYLPAEPSQASLACADWLTQLWEDDGSYNNKWMFDSGCLRRSPWKSVWKGEPWAKDAKGLLTDPDKGPLIALGVTEDNNSPTGYKLRHDNPRDAAAACSPRPA